MAGRDLAQRRLVGLAVLLRVAAARVEVAAARRVGRIGHLAAQQDAAALVAQARVGQRHGGEERLGVRVHRALVQLVGVGHLDQLADVHHRDPVTDVLDHAEVVGDEEVGQVELALQVLQQVDDLRAHRDIERGDRLVGDHQARVERERAGDADALPLAAAEGVRVAAHVLGAQPHPAEQLGDAILQLPAGGDLVDPQRIGDDLEDGHARVQRRVGILEDHADVAPVRLEIAEVELRQVDRPAVPLVIEDLPAGGVVGADDRAPGGRLAAARLADQAEGLALADEEVDPVHGLDMADRAAQEALLDREVHLEVLDLQQHLIRLAPVGVPVGAGGRRPPRLRRHALLLHHASFPQFVG